MRSDSMTRFECVADITRWLNQFEHPWLHHEWADTPNVVSVAADGTLSITLPFAANTVAELLEQWVIAQKQQHYVASDLNVAIRCRVAPLAAGDKTPCAG
ncbi:scaffold protein for [4Fe-4S] cluster assembly ApbC MRP-like [Photobacterium aphoticum]|uniref:Scaffold protein for [4Fe-4S] cluster assembly ApbC MRP-like n=1 Tax=Photobacterium aphoticum TaxID=754436 RepID=A0A090QNY8_9GAMM|nr:scaffold protein for [4Fe-4S] cluster assembly ApbC MRP-like [Photobacterium aphoticum]